MYYNLLCKIGISESILTKMRERERGGEKEKEGGRNRMMLT